MLIYSVETGSKSTAPAEPAKDLMVLSTQKGGRKIKLEKVGAFLS